MEKSLKKHLFTGLTASFFIVSIILLGFFLVSADGTIANTKNYDSTTKTISITNNSGIEIAKMQLNTPQINYVASGKNILVAEFTINNSYDYSKGVFNGIDFINLNNGKTTTRQFTYKSKIITGTKDVNDYKEVCNPVNITATICHQELTGTHKENVYDWKEFTAEDLSNFPKGNITIGLFADVNKGDNVEWMPTLYGIKITEWAIWINNVILSDNFADGSVNTTIWYNTTGAKETANSLNISDLDASPHYFLTKFDFNTSTSWKIQFNISWDFITTGQAYIAMCNATNLGWGELAGGTNCAFSTGPGPLGMYYTNVKNLAKTQHYIVINSTNRNVTFYNWDNSINSTMTYTAGKMYLVFGVYDGGYGSGVYINLSVSNFNVYELTDVDTINPNIKITFPLNNTLSNSKTLNVNYSASDLNLAYCWYSNDTYLKNTTLTNCKTNLTTMSWEDGQHNVTIWANDTWGNENSSSVRFNIDTIAPVITINEPQTTSTSLTFNVNLSITDASSMSYCSYNITRGAGTEVATTPINLINFTEPVVVSGYANYLLTTFCNDTAGNINITTKSFSISAPSGSSGSIGGGGGFWDFIIPQNTTRVSVCKPFEEVFYNCTNEVTNPELLDKIQACYREFLDFDLCKSAASIVPL